MDFNAEQRRRLRELGLTEAKISELARSLHSVWEWLRDRPRTKDVKDELNQLAKTLEQSARRVERWRNGQVTYRAPDLVGSEALGALNLALAQVVRSPLHPARVDLADHLAPDYLVEVLASAAKRATESYEVQQRRDGGAGAEAVRRLVAALGEVTDPTSRESGNLIRVSREGPFLVIAEIVWEAVGNTSSPQDAIRQYLSQTRRNAPRRRSPGAKGP